MGIMMTAHASPKEGLEAVLQRVREWRTANAPDLNIEEVGRLAGWLETAPASGPDAALAEKAQQMIARWQKASSAGKPRHAAGKERRAQEQLRTVVYKLRGKLFANIDESEALLAHGAVEGLRGVRHKSEDSMRLEALLSEGLSAYSRYQDAVLAPEEASPLHEERQRKQRLTWLLAAAFLGIIGLGVWYALAPPAPAPAQAASTPEQAEKAQYARLLDEGVPERISPQEEARQLIAGYQEQVAEDPARPDAAGLLFAAGNLARQKLQDYEQAAQLYERILYEYPDWPGIRQVWLELAAAYERTGDEDNVRWTYERMAEHFPANSQEHQYAVQRLGR